MTYEEFITRVAREVRDRAWPEPDSSVTSEQLAISHASVLAVAVSLPIYELDDTDSTLLGADSVLHNGYASYGLPDDIFTGREDLGVFHHEFDGVQYDVSQTMPINSLRMIASNSYQSDNVGLFSYDSKYKTLNIIGADDTKDVTLVYVNNPVEPTTGNYGSIDVPLPGSELQRTIHMVAAHIAGSRLRDSAASQFQSILSKNYG